MTVLDTEPIVGGHMLVDALLANGVDTAFRVPGESYLPVLDGLYEHRDQIALHVCRHEGGAAFMAEACGKKLTGKPGICLVTRGPGACNASIGVHAAAQDAHRDRVVLSWNGDGSFMTNGQELATAVRYGLDVVFVVVNNGIFGTIRSTSKCTIRAAPMEPGSTIRTSARRRTLIRDPCHALPSTLRKADATRSNAQ